MGPELLPEIRSVHVILQQFYGNLYSNPGTGITAEMFLAAMAVRRHRDGKGIRHIHARAVLTDNAFPDMAVSGYRGMQSPEHFTNPHQTRYPGHPDSPDPPHPAHPV